MKMNIYYDGEMASAEYIQEDGVWFGKILNTRDCILFEALTFDELKREMRISVEEWRSM